MNEEKENKKQSAELSPEELQKVTGGALNDVKFGDIPGESTDKDHKDWVTILQYNHAMTTTPAPSK